MFCYALTPSDGSQWRTRIEAEAEHFLDVSTWSAAQTAQRMSDDGIQVDQQSACRLARLGREPPRRLPRAAGQRHGRAAAWPGRRGVRCRLAHARPPPLPPQIAVNLNGYTKGARNEIFALQPAPVQVR